MEYVPRKISAQINPLSVVGFSSDIFFVQSSRLLVKIQPGEQWNYTLNKYMLTIDHF